MPFLPTDKPQFSRFDLTHDNTRYQPFTQSPTITAETSVPSRTPTGPPKNAKPKTKASSTNKTSFTIFMLPKDFLNRTDDASTMPSPG